MADSTTPASPKSGGSSKLKTMIAVAVMLVLEAAVIIAVMMFAGGPPSVEAMPTSGELVSSEDEKIVETLILDAKLFNSRTGVPYLYNTEVYAHVKRKHAEGVCEELEQFQNEIKAEIAAIWKLAEPHQFQEAKNESLTRKVYALLNERFGNDLETGESIIQKCIVYMGTGLRVD